MHVGIFTRIHIHIGIFARIRISTFTTVIIGIFTSIYFCIFTSIIVYEPVSGMYRSAPIPQGAPVQQGGDPAPGPGQACPARARAHLTLVHGQDPATGALPSRPAASFSVGDFANLRRRMIVSIFVENYANLRRRFRQSPSETEISPISVLLSIQKSNGLCMLPMLYPRERPSTKPRDPLSGRDATRQVASLRSRPARPGPTTAAVRASPVVR